MALLRIRSHDIHLFSTLLKSAGNAFWSYISVLTNLVEMRHLSEVTAGNRIKPALAGPFPQQSR